MIDFLGRVKLRMDNLGENKKLQKILKDKNLNVSVEFTPRDTPQYNTVVERAFATLYGRIRAMLNGGGFLIWKEY